MTVLTPADDYVHPVGPEPNFNESMYFHFHDPAHGIGGFFRLANRPNEGRGERTVCLYLSGGTVAFGFARPRFADPADFRAGGLSVETVEPYQRLRVSFDGQVSLLSDPSSMIDPKAALSSTPILDCSAKLELTAHAPAHAQTFDGDGESFAPHHYEQLMQVAGTIRVGENTYPVGGFGLRDHSWGPRSWQAPWFYRWMHGSAANFGFMGAFFADEDGVQRTGGFVWDGEQLHQVRNVSLTTDRDADHQPRSVTIELSAPGQRWTFTGKAETTVPLRHRRPDSDKTTRIAEACMTWTTSGGQHLYGMAEYLDQIVDGLPVGLHV